MTRKYTKKPKRNKIVTTAGIPDFRHRSKLVISPGLWTMRNGHTAKVDRAIPLHYADAAGRPQIFTVWIGKCVDCNEPKTFNINGTYAVIGKHANDIVGRHDG